MTHALEGIRVLEQGSLPAMSYCGKLFADLGAEVLKVEPPTGDPLRQAQPHVPETSESISFAWLNGGKGSLVTPDGAPPPERLQQAHVLLDASDPKTAAARHLALRQGHPELVIISLSWFGESGPYAGFAGSDAVCRAMAGLVQSTGPEAGPPRMMSDHHAAVFTGLTAFTAATAALCSEATGRRFEISALDASLVVQEFPSALSRTPAYIGRRLGINHFFPTYPLGIYACREGWLGVTASSPAQWRSFCELLGFEDWSDDPELQTSIQRLEHMEAMDRRITARLQAHTAQEWFEQARQRRLPIVVVPTIPELLRQEALRQGGAFGTVRAGSRVIDVPVTPLKLTRTPPVAYSQAPQLGNARGWRNAEAAMSSGGRSPVSRPLAGIQILDLTMGWAGPLATRQLADLGAEVYKLEACQYPDWFRPNPSAEERAHERNPHFAAMNRQKLGGSLDLYSQAGRDTFKRLVRHVDAVVENYSADVMPKLGLTYEALREVNPGIVMMSMPAFSNSSAWRSIRAYGSTLEQGSGLPAVTGEACDPPALLHLAYGDPNGGLNGAAALVAALLHRRRTGEGQYIDLSQVQAMLPLVGPWIAEHSVTGSATRHGNRHPDYAPQGVFPCAGLDRWIAISVTDDAAWRGLCCAMGCAALGEDPRFRTAAQRRARYDEIASRLSAWTQTQEPETAMQTLQANGVAAGVVRAAEELYSDPHLLTRGSWQCVDRPWSGPQPILRAPFREEGWPYPIDRPAPTLGQHTAEILCDRFGLGREELTALQTAGVCGEDVVRSI